MHPGRGSRPHRQRAGSRSPAAAPERRGSPPDPGDVDGRVGLSFEFEPMDVCHGEAEVRRPSPQLTIQSALEGSVTAIRGSNASSVQSRKRSSGSVQLDRDSDRVRRVPRDDRRHAIRDRRVQPVLLGTNPLRVTRREPVRGPMSEIVAQAVTVATISVLAVNAAATAPTRRALADNQRPNGPPEPRRGQRRNPARISDSGPVSSRGAANTEGDCSGGCPRGKTPSVGDD